MFFIELQEYKDDDDVQRALIEIEKYYLKVKVLGRYPNQRPENLS